MYTCTPLASNSMCKTAISEVIVLSFRNFQMAVIKPFGNSTPLAKLLARSPKLDTEQ